MNTKFKKGDLVWSITAYNRKATVCVKKLLIKSFGKVQGTAFNINTNDMAKYQLYANQVEHLYLVNDVADINEFAMQKAIQQKTDLIQSRVNGVHQNWLSGHYDEHHCKFSNQDCQEIMDSQPTVIFK